MHCISLVDSSMCLCTHLRCHVRCAQRPHEEVSWSCVLSETEQGIKSANMNSFVINVA